MSRNQKTRLPASAQVRNADDMAYVAELTDELVAQDLQTAEGDDFRVEEANPETVSRSERLRGAVRKAGGNKAVSSRAGIPISTLGMYIAGREMKVSAAVALAEACGVGIEWLITGRDGAQARIEQRVNNVELTNTFTSTTGAAVASKKYAIVPRYDVAASAGPGRVVEDEKLAGYLALDEVFLHQVLRRRQKDLVSIEATGDSMEPNIHDGDLLVIDTSVTEIHNSRIYVLNIDGELLVKRLSLRLDGTVVVRSDNDKYEPETVKPSERRNLRIVGQVVYQAGPVRS